MGLKSIAQRSGVSVSTVSRVLSGSAKISDEVRTRVIAIAQEEGYLGTRGRGAAHGILQTLVVVAPSALLAPSETNYVSWTIFEALRQVAAERGTKLIPVISEGERLDPDQIIGPLTGQASDGIVVFFDETPQVLSRIAALGRNTVLLAGQDPTMQIPSVGIGNRFGARLGADYLLSLGHRRIALLTWDGRYTIRQREDGYREAMEHVGEAPAVFHLPSFHPEVAEREMGELWRRGALEGVTALFALADNVALAAMRALRREGVRIPEDMSVLGFDDAVAGEMANPPLSTIHAPLRAIGPAALDELERQLRAGDPSAPVRRIELGCSLVTRRSCAPLAPSGK